MCLGHPGWGEAAGRKGWKRGALRTSPEWERQLRVNILIANLTVSLTLRETMS